MEQNLTGRRELHRAQPRFAGDWEDLHKIVRLIQSPIHSDKRERALKDWIEHNRQKAGSLKMVSQGGGVDLRGVCFDEIDARYIQLYRAKLDNASITNSRLKQVLLQEACLVDADLSGSYLHRVDLSKADLTNANFKNCFLGDAILDHATLTGAKFNGADLQNASLKGAVFGSSTEFVGANMSGCDLSNTVVSGDMRMANLERAIFVETELINTILNNSRVFGIAAWKLKLMEVAQHNLIITPEYEPEIRVDNLKMAQFMYLLLNNEEISDVFNSAIEKAVLILGRFESGGLKILQAIAAKLREDNYLPIIFDFARPEHRTFTETVKTLVGLSRFVIVDLSGPSVPQEFYATASNFQIPFIPILEGGRELYTMAIDMFEKDWVLSPPVRFKNKEDLLAQIPQKLIEAEAAIEKRRAILKERYK